MSGDSHLTCTPLCGSQVLKFAGDFFTIQIRVKASFSGKAFLRNNINQSRIRQQDVIDFVEKKRPNLDRGWHDSKMLRVDDTTFELSIPLLKIGHFSCKPYLQDEFEVQEWPDGENININTEPPAYRSDNGLYCAFVRQFGPNKKLAMAPEDCPQFKELDKKGYTLIPPSGKFRDLVKELDHIFDDLGCRILHLLPINPTPTSYGRVGRFGSPYAALDFTAINPELAEFDLHATPLEQFGELVDAVHCRSGRLIIDIAINHTGWAAKIHESNPEWLKRHDDGRIHQPGAWGTVWEDLTELDHNKKELWIYLADVFLTWCERGVDGFRCDAGYMIPAEAWKYITAKVRQKYPDTLFLLEGLGGPWETTENLLSEANLNWAYSEIFQNYSKDQIKHYLEYSQEISNSRGLMIHYAETHDNNRLAEKSPSWSRMRTTLCALLSHNGTFGFTNGVEWFAKEKIWVHRASGLNWDNQNNQVKLIKNLTTLLKEHPAFYDGSSIEPFANPNSDLLCVIRRDKDGLNPLFIAINLNTEEEISLQLSADQLPQELSSLPLSNFLTHSPSMLLNGHERCNFELAAGEALCLGNKESLNKENYNLHKTLELLLMKILGKYQMSYTAQSLHEDALALKDNPQAYFEKRGIICVQWQFPRDIKRHVLYSSYSTLIMSAPHPFKVKLFNKQLSSFPANNDLHYVIFKPHSDEGQSIYKDIALTVFSTSSTRYKAKILHLSASDSPFKGQVPDNKTPRTALATNGRGGMMHFDLNWPQFSSRYDCLLGANLSTEFPENRHIMWRRLRLYCQHGAVNHPLDHKTLESSSVHNGRAEFIFCSPVGMGHHVRLKVTTEMIEGKNASAIHVSRLPAYSVEALQDDEAVSLIMRPDIEDRNFHMEAKLNDGIKQHWINSLKDKTQGFEFTPDPTRHLHIDSNANFTLEHEWTYNHNLPIEAQRGLTSQTDLYSPGFFSMSLKSNESCEVLAQVITPAEKELLPLGRDSEIQAHLRSFPALLKDAMNHYIVKRGELKTVIAGYPWFLDWGRDTLICVRGMISAGFTDEVRKTLLQFASFEEDGTLPNMIHGGDAGNRDTSDAPLWFFTACEDLMKFENSQDLLDEMAGDRSLKEVLISLAENICKGTPNGITMDKNSGLIYSPSHFTWMDTNYPAGTPRQGYPVEIQALWHAALTLLSKTAQDPKWSELAVKVKENFIKFYWCEERGFLSDCIHSKGEEASLYKADDALRCNQLFAITLNVIDGDIAKKVLASCEELLIPGAIRSLADRPTHYPLAVKNADGHTINDPHAPYWGHYEGDEDTRRKPAYHNGTAWSWPFPSYSEALFKIYGESARLHARAILNSSRVLFDSGCLGQIPEVLDGNAPHRSRGCDAQAWGISELLRVWNILL